MSEEEIMSEEAINELINGFEIVGSLTKYGRKNIKYHFQRLQQENEQLQNNRNELKKWLEDKLKEPIMHNLLYDGKRKAYKETLEQMQELENKPCHTTSE